MTTDHRTAARCEQAEKVYGNGEAAVRALDGVSAEFPAGVFTAIMGPSGSGKSTLLHCLAGLDVLSGGKTFIGDVDLTRLSERQLTQVRRDKVGFVFQAFNLIPTLSAAENISLPLAIGGKEVERAWMGQVVGKLGLANRLSHRPSQLSGGQQQRVAAARALVSRPEIVFADEPTGNLDSHSAAGLLEFLVQAVREFGQTIVMVTHDPAVAARTDRVLFLQDGRVVDELAGPTLAGIHDRMQKLTA